MSAEDFTRVAGQLDNLVKNTREAAMHRVVLQGERIAKHEAPVYKGPLRRSITSRVEANGNRGIVGTNIKYGRAVHNGSGIYGPTGQPIRPKVKKALFWKGALHPVKSVKGQKPNPFFIRTRDKLRPIAERELQNEYGDALGKIQ